MGSTFDTIQWMPLKKVLETTSNKDKLRMGRILLSNISISIKLGKHKIESVKRNTGSPQGDEILGIFLNIALENALRALWAELNKKIQPEKSSIPTEIIYADDSDFISEDSSHSKVLKEIVKESLGDLIYK